MPLHANAEQMASHVAYEVVRLHEDALDLQRRVGTVVSSGPQLQGVAIDQAPVNRSLESFLLHVRNIYDVFFVLPRKNTPDVSFDHFLDAGHGWAPDPARLCPYLHSQRERLNRSIQHLSFDRIGYEPQKNWNIGTIVSEIDAVWEEFLRYLPAARRCWFASGGRPAQGGSPVSPNLCVSTQS
jgi:hypothetical protein